MTVTVVDHPLVQHKLTIMRKKETSTAGFRRLLREISHAARLRGHPQPRTDDGRPSKRRSRRWKRRRWKARSWSSLRSCAPATACSRACSTWCRRPASPMSGSTATTKRWKRSNISSRRRATLSDRLVIVVDPMLATANSAIAAIDKLKERGATNMRFLCLLAARRHRALHQGASGRAGLYRFDRPPAQREGLHHARASAMPATACTAPSTAPCR
jgi:uracil phosphoribosyltransferase